MESTTAVTAVTALSAVRAAMAVEVTTKDNKATSRCNYCTTEVVVVI